MSLHPLWFYLYFLSGVNNCLGDGLKAGYLKVGMTRSGKDILVSFIEDAKLQVDAIVDGFSTEDVFDAYAVFEYFSIREYRRTG